jgi:two-component sensor histidine kinase
MAEDVRAEIVASVLEVVVHEGDQIGEGDTLVLLESMKMEIPVLAEVAGTTLGDLLAEHTILPGNAVDHLHAVVGEWQLLADLSFADYLMWVRRDDGVLVCVAQIRPNTAPTVLLADAVGTRNEADEMPLVTDAFNSGAIGRQNPAGQQDSLGLNVEAVPVRYNNEVVAVLTHQTALAARKASPLETAYLDCAGDLLHMLSEATFPNVGDLAMSRSSPRVGDGFIRLDETGGVVFASPNAISAYHRMGLASELEGHNLVTITRPLIGDPFEAQELANHVRDSLAGGSSMRMEVDAGGAAVLLRTLPLVVHGKAVGAAVLIRDVTEVKRRDRALLSKDATIREIHHRVKNNLQTVAALLRLQARRTNNAEGREALIESVRRVSSIALVHDALSMSVDEEVNLDEVVDRILPIMNDVATVDTPIRINRVGDLGVLDADRATALIMVVTELVQNAIEHAFDTTTQQGCVTIRAERSARWLDVVVHDDGRGLPDGFSLEKSDRLGLQIVRTLVSAELDGSLGMHEVPTGGTDVVLRVPIGRKARLPQ